MPHNNKKACFVALLSMFCAVIAAKNVNAQELATNMEAKGTAVLSGLDKITGKVVNFEVPVNSSTNFGTLYLKVFSCQKAPSIEKPEAATFLKIWESKVNQEPKLLFSGWMFASSPALSAMDHAIYDIWITDCK